jgi:hypothetical protein
MKYFIFALIFINMSCKTGNNPQEESKNIDYSQEGFTKVEWVKSDLCGFILSTKSGERFEIENMADEILKNKSQMVWIKYHALRRMSKCENTTPIIITEYKLP